MKKIVFSWIVCVLALVVLVAWLSHGVLPVNTDDTSESSLITDEFTLQTADGKTVTEKTYSGKYLLIYFGYTHCPDMCPTSLLLMQNALSDVGPLAKKIQPLFITVDPARDTPKVTAAYAKNFGSQLIGLSGTPMQIKHVADNFKVYYSKVENDDRSMGYMMSHSGFIYLMGPDGRFLTHFNYNASERELEDGLKHYVH